MVNRKVSWMKTELGMKNHFGWPLYFGLRSSLLLRKTCFRWKCILARTVLDDLILFCPFCCVLRASVSFSSCLLRQPLHADMFQCTLKLHMDNIIFLLVSSVSRTYASCLSRDLWASAQLRILLARLLPGRLFRKPELYQLLRFRPNRHP